MSLNAAFDAALEASGLLRNFSFFDRFPKHPVRPTFLWVAFHPRQFDLNGVGKFVASLGYLAVFGARSFKISSAPCKPAFVPECRLYIRGGEKYKTRSRRTYCRLKWYIVRVIIFTNRDKSASYTL